MCLDRRHHHPFPMLTAVSQWDSTGPNAAWPKQAAPRRHTAGLASSLAASSCMQQVEFPFSVNSATAAVALSQSAIYGTLSFCRGLCISAFCNSFFSTMTPVDKTSRVCHQTTTNDFSKPYYLSFLPPLSQIKSYNVFFFFLKLRARAINSREQCHTSAASDFLSA